ncbi:MAG: type II toxin-antitoxin system PemK/MazF family toxin [Chloroflexi bacterium]|nr:type II toxin-antitoxin system PemK/MazF family toxin [Chloroflexota bacterium]
MMPQLPLQRGDVVYVDLGGAVGTEKQNRRPCVVVQNDDANRASPLTIVVPITDADKQFKGYPQQVFVPASELGVGAKNSVIEGGHLRAIDREAHIDASVGVWWHLSDEPIARVDAALRASLAL